MEKVIFVKRPIDRFLTDCKLEDIDIMSTDEYCIDREGNLHKISLADVRALNDSYWNHNSDLYGEKISFTTDYIVVSVDPWTNGYITTANISSAVKPTDAQIESLHNFYKYVKKLQPALTFSAWWRWPGGGGCYLAGGKQLNRVVTSIKHEIHHHTFKGYNNDSFYTVEE